MTYWRITDKGDPDALALVDGKIDGITHYSRQTKGARMFTRNGQNIVLIAYNPGPVAAWVSFRPTPGKAVRSDKRDAVECALFKLVPGHGLRKPTGGRVRASHLIREASELTSVLWGEYRDGLITFIKPDLTTAQRDDAHPVGWSYRMAGWRDDRPSSDGKPCLRAPAPQVSPADLYRWTWSGVRGGASASDVRSERDRARERRESRPGSDARNAARSRDLRRLRQPGPARRVRPVRGGLRCARGRVIIAG